MPLGGEVYLDAWATAALVGVWMAAAAAALMWLTGWPIDWRN